MITNAQYAKPLALTAAIDPHLRIYLHGAGQKHIPFCTVTSPVTSYSVSISRTLTNLDCLVRAFPEIHFARVVPRWLEGFIALLCTGPRARFLTFDTAGTSVSFVRLVVLLSVAFSDGV